MAVEVKTFKVTIPHGTLSTSPASASLNFPPREVEQINIRIPPGPRGEVGFVVGSDGVPIVPDNSGAWIITDDETLQFPLSGQINSGAWDLIGYNTGTYDHRIWVTFLLNLVGGPVLALVNPVVNVVGSVV